MIGLDRITLNNIILKSINIQLIELLGGKVIVSKKNVGYKTIDQDSGEVIYLSELKMNIEGFGWCDKSYAIQLQLNKDNGYEEWTVSAGINVPKLYYANNLNNIHKQDQIQGIPWVLEGYMKERGIEVDLTNATVTSLEVNYNIKDKEFYKTMTVINEAWKHSGQKVFVADTKDGIESLKLKLPTREIKVYNKVKQLQDVGYKTLGENDVTRIEVSSNHITTIKSVLGGNKLTDLIENYPKLVVFYKNTVKSSIYKPFKKYCDDNVKIMYELLKDNKASKVLDIMGLNRVVDLDLYKEAIVKYYKSSGKRNPYNMIKNNIDRVRDKENYIGNIQRIENFVREMEK